MKNTVMTRIGALLLALVMVMSMAACGAQEPAPTDPPAQPTDSQVATPNETEGEVEHEPVVFVVGGMPDKDAKPEEYAAFVKNMEDFEELYPWIDVQGSTVHWDVSTFYATAAAGQLPDYNTAPVTEINKITTSGYATDLTEALKANGWYDMMNEDLRNMVTVNGQICTLPTSAYAMGLSANYSVLEEAGVLNADGSIDWPETWEELGEMGGKIKAATGKAGISFPTAGNCGGWHFTSIAWSYGVEFVKQDENGKWVANFANDECAAALQMISDWKWKYDALSDDLFLNYGGYQDLFKSAQSGFVLTDAEEGWMQSVIETNGRDAGDIHFSSVPAGPEGKFELTGGNIVYMGKTDDPGKIDAFLKWIAFRGQGPEVSEGTLQNQEGVLKSRSDAGVPIMASMPCTVWTSGEAAEALAELRAKYAAEDQSQYAAYLDMDGVVLHPEVELYCQELYAILDGVIQEVLNNKNADIPALLANAANDYQVNYLDNMN